MTTQTQASGPRPGDQLGEFRILHLIGEGAMGKVYEARQLSLQRRVALKVLPVETRGGDNQAVTRFYREARAAAQLHHPNIVPVYDFGFEQGSYYYAMQYVAGKSLHELIHERPEAAPPLDERQVATWMLNVARGLHAAHGDGVIHRDIKPANIMVREDGEAVITDFGLSRHEKRKSITQSGALMGTPVYMAPEQARGEKVDGTIDVYALGVTLYEALTGRVPFVESNLRELLIAITSSPPRPPSELRPGLSPDLEAITLKALAKEPADRYPTAQAMADDLLQFLRGEVVTARQAEVGELERMWLRLEKQPLVVGLLALNALVIVGALLVNAWLLRSRPVERAQQKREAAEAIVSGPLGAWERARDELSKARAARDAVVRGPGRADPDPAVTRARLALIDAERKLLEGREGAPPAEQALVLLQEALALAPGDHSEAERTRALAQRVVAARLSASRRRGDAPRAAALARELERLGGASGAPATLKVETKPAGAQVLLSRVTLDERGFWGLSKAEALGESPLEHAGLAPGEYVVELQLAGRVPTRAPLRIRSGRDSVVQVRLELPDASRVPAGFVYIPPGEFLAGGDPKAVRPLFREPEPTWLGGFFLAATEVTVEQYAAFLRALPDVDRETHRPRHGPPTLDAEGQVQAPEALLDHPVTGVRFESAQEYCRWWSKRSGRKARLPTGAEWEKAARGPFGRAFPWGDRLPADPTERVSNLHRRDAAQPPTAPVGSHRRDRSIYRVLDLGGNASEWVDGAFGGSGFHVIRGGSFVRGPEVTRSASREAVGPKGFPAVAKRVGFRVALD